MSADETLKLTFTVLNDVDSQTVQPHQTFLRFHDDITDEEGIVPVKVSKDGKAKFSMVRQYNPSTCAMSNISARCRICDDLQRAFHQPLLTRR